MTGGLDLQPVCPAAISRLLLDLCRCEGSVLPSLEWSRRMVSSLGKAYQVQGTIRLSAWLSQEQADDTLRHELAHILAGREGAGRPHGRQWRSWAVRLGAEPSARAKGPPALAPVRRASVRYWGLECPLCGLRLARARVSRGLYHGSCGPQRGTLRRVFRALPDEMAAWIAGHPNGQRA